LIVDKVLLGGCLYRTFTQNLKENDLKWIRYIALESTLRGETHDDTPSHDYCVLQLFRPWGWIMFVTVLWAVPRHLRKHAGAQVCPIVKDFMLFMLLCTTV
jgi:hypothetical protein